MGEWFEEEGFWTDYAPLMFDESSWAEVEASVDGLLQLAALRPPARVLDLCCGVGRHSLEFARRGFKVTGVDITTSYLQAAMETAAAENLDVEFLKEDARCFSRPGFFDLCVNLFTSFGYFGTRREDLEMAASCRRNLKSGGVFFIETLGKELAARDFTQEETFERSGWQVTARYEILGDWEYRKNRWMLQKDGASVDRDFTLRLYSGVEMKDLLDAAGFRRIRIFGGYDGRPYDDKAESLVAVAVA